MSYFKNRKLSESEVFERGRFIVPGTYDLRVIEHRIQTSRKRKGVDYFIAKFTILACDDVDSEPGRTGPKFKAGQECSWNVNMTLGPSDSNIKKHFRVLFPDVDPDSPKFDEVADACLEENLAEGLVIGAHAYHVMTDDGNPFTVVDWYPIVDPAGASDE